MKSPIISFSLLLVLCFGIYRSYAASLRAQDGCICGRIYLPVCASDMKTYKNRCLYECARKKLANKGRSLSLFRSGVCGDDRRRSQLADEEQAVLAQAAVANEDHKFVTACKCDRSLEQVCASDNRTYNNPCLFNCRRSILARSGKGLTVLRKGACV